MDSQAVKNTCNAAVESKGFCPYKATHGIKRHLAVDSLGFPFFTHCTRANVSDDVGLIEMLTAHIDYFKRKPVNLAKITILLDHGYPIERIVSALQAVYPGILRKVRFERSAKLSKHKQAQGQSGFVAVKARWVVDGEWTYRVGIPAKSGVGGGITGVVPGQLGIGTFSPCLDTKGNSVRGIKVFERLSQDFGLHLFNAAPTERSLQDCLTSNGLDTW